MLEFIAGTQLGEVKRKSPFLSTYRLNYRLWLRRHNRSCKTLKLHVVVVSATDNPHLSLVFLCLRFQWPVMLMKSTLITQLMLINQAGCSLAPS
jgi:hypothetical protein